METNPTPETRTRSRRADKYKQQSGTVPSSQLISRTPGEGRRAATPPAYARPTVPAQEASSAASRRFRQAAPQPMQQVRSQSVSIPQQPMQQVRSQPVSIPPQPMQQVRSQPVSIPQQPMQQVRSQPVNIPQQPMQQVRSQPVNVPQQAQQPRVEVRQVNAAAKRQNNSLPPFLRRNTVIHFYAPPQQQSGPMSAASVPQPMPNVSSEYSEISLDQPDGQASRGSLFPGDLLHKALVIGLAVVFFLCMVFLAAHGLMSAYLKTQSDNREAAHTAIVNAHPRSARSDTLITRYASEYGLHPAFVAAIILNESSFDANAMSSKGARGMMQLMPDTGSWIAQRLKVSNYTDDMLLDPETNIRFGCWYLKYLSDMFYGDPIVVTAAYHAGQNNVAGWMANRSYSPDGRTLPLENIPYDNTKTYAKRVIRDYGIYDALYYHSFNRADHSASAGSGR